MTDPLRVLELGSGISAAYAAKLLGDHGADVVKVEGLEGDISRRRGPFPDGEADPEKSGTFLAYNLNKRGICLDLDSEEGLESLLSLLSWADILVHNYSRLRALELGIDPETIKDAHPSLIVVSITPFGITGPHRDYYGEDITIANAGGWANLCPKTHNDPDLPPLKVFGQQCGLLAGINGALTALAMCRDVRRSGVGEYIDFSAQEYVASALEGGIPTYTYLGNVPSRYAKRASAPWRIYKTKNSHIFLVVIEQDQWERLVTLMGNPDWADLEVFADKASRGDNADMVNMFVEEFTSEWDTNELFHTGQKRRICFAPVAGFEQLRSNEHAQARGFFVPVDHPVAGTIEYFCPTVLTKSGRAAYKRPAPLLGEHTQEVLEQASDHIETTLTASGEPRLPLTGVRVVDLSWVWAGPFCAMNLAFLGAEVIRVESEARPDLYRRGKSVPPGMEPGLNRSGMFNQWNQSKSSVAVDLSKPEGKEITKALIAEADVVVQNFATGVLERLGLGYEVLKELNPGIILASISGFGQTGPYSNYLAYGPAFAALSGLSAMSGFRGSVGGEELGVSVPDPTAGVTTALAIVSALEKREQTGAGEHLDIGLWECTQALTAEGWMEYAFNRRQPEPNGNRDRWMAPHGCFPSKGDDKWVSIVCAGDTQWRALCMIIDPSLVDDDRFSSLENRKANEDALEELVISWTCERDRWDITRQLQAAGIATFPSFSCKDIIEDEHMNERGYVERLNHPEVGRMAHCGIPWRLQRRSNGVGQPAPCLGADTDRLLSDLLGYDSSKIEQLHQDKVLR